MLSILQFTQFSYGGTVIDGEASSPGFAGASGLYHGIASLHQSKMIDLRALIFYDGGVSDLHKGSGGRGGKDAAEGRLLAEGKGGS